MFKKLGDKYKSQCFLIKKHGDEDKKLGDKCISQCFLIKKLGDMLKKHLPRAEKRRKIINSR